MRLRKTTLEPESWRWTGGPRVLIEDPDETEQPETIAALRRAGYAVAVCPGPTAASPDGRHRCPLTADGECTLVDGADVVVSGLGLATPESRDVLQAFRLRRPGTRLVLKARHDELERWSELVTGCTVLPAPATPNQVVAAVSRLIAG